MTAHRLTINGHGMRTGDGPLHVSGHGALPAGLVAGADYYAIKIDADTIELERSWRRWARAIGSAAAGLWYRVLRLVKS